MTKDKLTEIQEKYSKELDLYLKLNKEINQETLKALIGSIIFDVLEVLQKKVS